MRWGIFLAALIVAAGLVVAGYLIGGRYVFTPNGGNSVIRSDRLTGDVALCMAGTKDSCEWEITSEPERPARKGIGAE